jgi:VWFA-related protein
LRIRRVKSAKWIVCLPVVVVVAIFLYSIGARAQNAPEQNAPAQNEPEVSTHDTGASFRVPVNLVLVRVVVRDSKGNVVKDLKKDDFRLLDNRKPQVISHFSVETPGAKSVVSEEGEKSASAKEEEVLGVGGGGERGVGGQAARFLALIFDDTVDMSQEDLVVARNAAQNFVVNATKPGDRVAIFTMSGQNQLDFTDDRDKLRAAIAGLQVRHTLPVGVDNPGECPPVNYYQADEMVNHNDEEAIGLATQDALSCEFNGDMRQSTAAQGVAMAEARTVLSAGDQGARVALQRVENLVKRIAAMPGERSIVLITPGFMANEDMRDMWESIDRANRTNVTINALDPRGLYTPESEGGLTRGLAPGTARIQYARLQQLMQWNVLEDLTNGTGGRLFRNNNDLEGGFRLLMGAPEMSYLLGFSPSEMRADGKFHLLKVTVVGDTKYSIQARRGYFSTASVSSTEVAKQEIEEAIFSRDEVRDLPVELHTQFYKTDALNAKLAVLSHFDVGRMRFRKEDERNRESVTIAAALFDQNGNYITGAEQVLDMKLRDATLEKLREKGVTVKTNFDVKPGDYVVRLVARDSEGMTMGEVTGRVEIPF